jgi:hypothetical protein
MAYATDYDLAASNTTFIQKCTMAGLSVAADVAVESTGTANHANRVILMTKVANAPEAYGRIFAFVCAVDGATTSSSTDAQIKTRITNAWNALAGVV